MPELIAVSKNITGLKVVKDAGNSHDIEAVTLYVRLTVSLQAFIIIIINLF